MLYANVVAAVRAKPSVKAQESKYADYKLYCTQRGWDPDLFTYGSVSRFICKHVSDNKGSTRSVDNVLSQLRKGCSSIRSRWLCKEECEELKVMIKQLK
jgi:hypothetical protein